MRSCDMLRVADPALSFDDTTRTKTAVSRTKNVLSTLSNSNTKHAGFEEFVYTMQTWYPITPVNSLVSYPANS